MQRGAVACGGASIQPLSTRGVGVGGLQQGTFPQPDPATSPPPELAGQGDTSGLIQGLCLKAADTALSI